MHYCPCASIAETYYFSYFKVSNGPAVKLPSDLNGMFYQKRLVQKLEGAEQELAGLKVHVSEAGIVENEVTLRMAVSIAASRASRSVFVNPGRSSLLLPEGLWMLSSGKSSGLLVSSDTGVESCA